MSRPEPKSRFFRKPTGPPPTDLEWLSGWAVRLNLHLEKDQPSEYSWFIFRPCVAGHDAMMRLSVEYHTIIDQVNGFLEFTEERFKDFMQGNGEVAEDNFCIAMGDLAGRIEAAVETIYEAEEKKAAKPSANSANTSKLFSGKVPKDPDLVDLAVKLDAEAGKLKDDRRSWNEIAREFTGETKDAFPKAKRLLSALRRMKRNSRVNL